MKTPHWFNHQNLVLSHLWIAITGAALLAAQTFTNAQNPHKPTARPFKPRIDETAPPQVEAGVQGPNEGAEAILPTTGPAIQPNPPVGPAWAALGPTPIPNGQTIPADANGISLTQAPVSGRLTAVAIDPADANTAYVGAAQGGVYQTRNGGLTWTPLMDSAITLAVGSLQLDPTDATGNTLVVGSGEGNFSGDSYAGFGVYKLTALKSGNPVLSGPFNQSPTATDVFSKRSISGLAVDPNNHNNVYVGSSTGQQGIGPQAFVGAPARGLFRSTNFFSGSPTFTKLTIAGLPAARGFAAGQGFYNLDVAIDPTNANNIYVVGTLGGTFLISRNGGGSFRPSNDTLHVDSHFVGVAPSNPSVIYTGNDGGVWRSSDKGLHWIDRNTATFSATQFESIAVHPTDPNFSIGGTQDNGTNFFMPDRTWTRVDFGDGGYSLIDQNATDTENVTMYHTYFNETGILIGFSRVLKTSCATEGQWSFRGAYTPPVDPTVHCDGSTDVFNGISLNDPVNFYAPMALGPGNPNTIYFGTNKLYRSTDKGDTMPVVSQTFPSIVSAIGISKTHDNVRIVGLDNGQVTMAGANTMQVFA